LLEPVERIAIAGGAGCVESKTEGFSDSAEKQTLILRPGD
jgi:hypothetical protein